MQSSVITNLGRIFSDDTRVKIILLLNECGELTTTDICTRLGVLQPRVSSHLSILLENKLVSVDEKGRQRVYTLSSKNTPKILADFTSLASPNFSISTQASKEVKINSPIRQCRSCYDHMAGVAGVELLNKMIRIGWLSKDANAGNKITYSLTKSGSKSLRAKGVNIDDARKSKRSFAYGCIDWTERTPHLGGSLGAAILRSLLLQGVVERSKGTRVLKQLSSLSKWIKS